MKRIENNNLSKAVVLAIVTVFIGSAFVPAVSSFNDENFIKSPMIKELLNTVQNTLDEKGSPLDIPDPWWNTEWMYSKEINIDHEKVDDDLNNFPVLISLSTDTQLADDTRCQNSGNDIVFTDSSGNKLNHEIEYFDGSTGQLVAWVNITSLSSTVNTTLYMYYGNSSATNQENPTGVWDSNYTAVWHMSNETTTTIADSTNYNNTGTKKAIDEPVEVAGIVQRAQDFDGSDDRISVSHNDSLTGFMDEMSVSAWLKLDTVEDRRQFLVCKFADQANRNAWFIEYRDDPSRGKVLQLLMSQDGSNYKFAQGSFEPVVGQWYHVAAVWESGQVPTFYVNGTLTTTVYNTGTVSSIYSDAESLLIGECAYNSDRNVDGLIDEARISNVARSAGWISAEFTNQQIPTAFYSLGDEISLYFPDVISPNPADNAKNVDLNPLLSIHAEDPQGDIMNITFRTINSSGDWIDIYTHTNVGNGTYNCTPTDMDEHLTRYYWSVNCTDGIFWVNQTFSFTTTSAPGPWWNNNWAYRKKIIIDHSLVEGNLTNFPMLINLTEDDDLALNTQSDGDDLMFTNFSGNQLHHEIEYFNGSSGELVAWVNLTILSSSLDTILYLYYGNPSCSIQENPGDVWGDCAAVWHMIDETSTTITDSTNYKNNGTKKAAGEPIEVAGIVGKAQDFDAGDDYIAVPHNASLNHGSANFTISAWVYAHSLPASTNGIVGKYPIGGTTTPWCGFETDYETGDYGFTVRDSAGNTNRDNLRYPVTADQWVYLVGVREGSTFKFYVDGVLEQEDTDASIGSPDNTQDLNMGRFWTSNSFDGSLDEIRIWSTDRNSSWIATEYNNQNDPDSFMTLGAEEVAPGPVIVNEQPVDGTDNVPVSLAQLTFDLSHSEDKLMNFTVTTMPNIGSSERFNVSEGTYTVTVNDLAYDTMYTWHVNVTDGSMWNNKSLIFTTESAPGPWWDHEWLYRKEIIIDHSLVDGNLTYFPVSIHLSMDDDLADDLKCQNNGNDIVFTNYSGNKLAHEIEYFNGSSGELGAWVNVTQLRSTENTIIYLYYGNTSSGPQENAAGVWSEDYQGVWHLHDDFVDSTSFENNATNHSSVDSVGVIGDGQYFNGTAYVTAPDHCLGISNNWTASTWFKSNSSTGQDYHYFLSTGMTDGVEPLSINIWQNVGGSTTDPGEIRAQIVDSESDIINMFNYGGANYLDDQWHLVYFTWDEFAHTLSIYVDGELEHAMTDTNVDIGSGTSNDLHMGTRTDFNSLRFHIGDLDEVRISNPVKNSSWIRTEYNNQYDPDSFFDVGLQETLANQAPVLSFEVPSDDATGVDITQGTVNVTIRDPDGDSFDWTIEGVYVNDVSGTSDVNGSKSATLITPLPYSISIVWYVNASDGIDSTEVVYDFTTRAQYIPSPPAGFTATAVNRTQIDLAWVPDAMADKTYIEQNSISSWSMGAGIEIYNGTGGSNSDWGLIEGTQYYYQAWSWNDTDNVYSSSYAADDATTIANQAPVLSFEVPTDDSTDVSISQASVNVTIIDPDDATFDWTIQGLYVNDASGTGEANGSKQTSLITPLPYDTSIVWYVNASDGTDSTEVIYDFTTEAESIEALNVDLYAPADESTLDYDDVTFECNITDDTGIKNVSLYSNISGSWELMETKNTTGDEYEYDASMALWMHLNKDSGYGETDTLVYDFSGNERNGTVNGATHSTAGKYDGAYSFDGVNNAIFLPDDDYDLPGQPGATMAAWVKPASGQTSDSGSIIFLDRGSPSSTRMLISVNSNQTIAVKGRSGPEAFQSCFSTVIIPLGEWSHIIGILNLTSNTAHIYINGEHSFTKAMAFTLSTFDSTTTQNAGLGAIAGYTTYSYKGMIDEAAVYNRVLTDEEIMDVYKGKGITSWNVTFDVDNIDDGTYEWNCQAYDEDDNDDWADDNWEFTIETIPENPIVTLTQPGNNSIVDEDVTFNCTITDGTGVKNASLYSNISGTWELVETITPGEYEYDTSMNLWMHLNKDADYGETASHVYDFSGQGNNGTASGATYTTDGKIGGAYSFDDLTDDNIALQSGKYGLPGESGASMAAWVKPASGQTSDSGTIIFIDRAGASATRMLISVNSDRTVSVKGRSADETFQITTTTETIPYDEWSHIVGVINLTSNSAQVYIDGDLSTSESKAFTQSTFDDTTSTNAGLGAIIGYTQFSYTGLIDEAALYNKSLLADDVGAIYNQSRPTNWDVTFEVEGISPGTYDWNVLAYDIDDNTAWADDDWTFAVEIIDIGIIDSGIHNDDIRYIGSDILNVTTKNLGTVTTSFIVNLTLEWWNTTTSEWEEVDSGSEGPYDLDPDIWIESFFDVYYDFEGEYRATFSLDTPLRSDWIDDNSSNDNYIAEYTVETLDVTPPEISDVSVLMSDPKDTVIGWENISCTITDDIGVESAWLNITYPDLHTENISMTQSGDTYYYNTTLSDVGTYNYFIWANDTSDNVNTSSVDTFDIPPNWDVNIDHQCSIVDLIWVAGHFDDTGVGGWIREDIDNNGEVEVLDLVLVANHFDETW